MSTVNSETDAMVLDFIETSREALDSVESGLIELEKDTTNTEILNEIFRAIHSIKGTAGFLSFDKVVSLSHVSEELLNKLRKDEIKVTSDIIDIVLKANDSLRELIGTLAEGSGEAVDIDGIVEEINNIL